jgi:peptidoglycan/xylan/chitin deacetylase (PgdA/CDA1 family)
MRSWVVGVFACVLVFSGGQATAADCPGHPDALGTSRILYVDPTEHRLLGTMQYRETLPLAHKEVVLTFDDGPIPPYSARVLETLASQCVKATYFLVGSMARAHPDMVRRIAADGHTIGTHSQNHPLSFHKMPLANAEREINDGIASVGAALGGEDKVAPFFRIPGLLRVDQVESFLATRHIMTWSADFPGDDWKKIGAQEIVNRSLARLEAKGKGVLLLHDIQPATVLALPILLGELKARGYKVVHVMPASAAHPKTQTVAAQWLMRPPKSGPATIAWPEPIPLPPVTAAELLPAPGLATIAFAESLAGSVRPLAEKPDRKAAPRASRWPQRTPIPSVIDMAAREELPAPNPESFGYTNMIEAKPAAPDRRAAATTPVDPAASPTAPVSCLPGDITGSLRPSLGLWPRSTFGLSKSAYP